MNQYHYLLCVKLKVKGENFLKTGNPRDLLEPLELLKNCFVRSPKAPVQLETDIIVDFPAFVEAGSPRSFDGDLFYRIATPGGTCFINYPSDLNSWFNICDAVDEGKLSLLPWTELKSAIELDAKCVAGSRRSCGEAALTSKFFQGC